MPDDFPFPDLGDTSFDSATAIGPRAQVTTTAFLLPFGTALQIMHGQRRCTFGDGRIIGIFFANTPRRRTEFATNSRQPIPGPQPRLMVEFAISADTIEQHNATIAAAPTRALLQPILPAPSHGRTSRATDGWVCEIDCIPPIGRLLSLCANVTHKPGTIAQTPQAGSAVHPHS